MLLCLELGGARLGEHLPTVGSISLSSPVARSKWPALWRRMEETERDLLGEGLEPWPAAGSG